MRICAALVLAFAADAPGAQPPRQAPVQIRYTAFGVPHVKAATFAGVGFGLGYAFARENLCIGVELALTLAGERSAAFGEDGSYVDGHLGQAPIRNLESDFYYRYLYTDEVAQRMRAQLSQDGRELVGGYVRGFNRFLAETPAGRRPSPCRTATWLRPLTETDVYRRINHLAVLESTHGYLSGIAGARKPEAGGAPRAARAAGPTRSRMAGSNMAAFGRQTTENGRGVSYANPHFPWLGPQRMYLAQLTVPGKYDAFGAMLYGTPFILLGFNKDVGWSITYSTNHRAAMYRLRLTKESPTRYVVDGRVRDLEPVQISVQARSAAGKLVTRTRTFYRTEDGPLIDTALYPWTDESAHIYKDANRNLGRWPDQFLETAKARRVLDIKRSAERIRGHMFSNVTAADRHGDAIYMNFSPSINMPDADLRRCLVADGERFLREDYLYVLDGSRSDCAFRRDGDPIDPQILPARRAPWTLRADYVMNANDSHWLVNADPSSVLEGFDAVVGPERIARGERTRMGLRMIENRLAGRDGLVGRKISPENLRRMFYRAETVTGAAIMPDTLADCRANPRVLLAKRAVEVDLTKACAALAAWDGTARTGAVGAILVREYVALLPREVRSTGLALTAETWRVPFDPARPIDTPSGLRVSAVTREALAEAVQSLKDAGIPYDTPLGEVQFLQLDGRRVPASGFPFGFHMLIAQPVPRLGFTNPRMGDSYIHAVTFDDAGPVADVVLAYSQSTDPSSPHSTDFTRAYAEERWVRMPFLESDIVADPDFELLELTP
jgi:acyl-homoserine-lactone acylase